MANVINKAFRYSTPDLAIGNREDEPADNVDSEQTLISLLKAILENGSLAPAQMLQTNIVPRLAELEARVKALEERGP